MADNATEVQKLYVAYFSRPADPAGLAFWIDQMNQNAQLAYQNISKEFSTSTEYRTTYGGMSNEAVVGKVYLNLFGRAAEQAGVTWWADQLNKGNMTIDNVVTSIAAGAQGSDLYAYNAKVAVSSAFTVRVDTAQEKQAYSGTAANKLAIDFIATVKDMESAAAARDPGRIDEVIASIVNGGGSGYGAELVGLPPEMPPMWG